MEKDEIRGPLAGIVRGHTTGNPATSGTVSVHPRPGPHFIDPSRRARSGFDQASIWLRSDFDSASIWLRFDFDLAANPPIPHHGCFLGEYVGGLSNA